MRDDVGIRPCKPPLCKGRGTAEGGGGIVFYYSLRYYSARDRVLDENKKATFLRSVRRDIRSDINPLEFSICAMHSICLAARYIAYAMRILGICIISQFLKEIISNLPEGKYIEFAKQTYNKTSQNYILRGLYFL